MDTYRNGRKLFEDLHQDYSFDAIIIYQPFSGLGPIRSPLSGKIRKIYTCFSFSFEEFISRNPCGGGILQKLKYLANIHTRKWIENSLLKSCDSIVVLSQYTRERLGDVYRIPPQNVSIIPGGIDLLRFKPAKNKQILRKRLNMPDGKVILFSVRNLVPRMGLENLIKALKKIVPKAPDIYLVLGGEGPLKKDLALLSQDLGLNDCIRFAGYIPEEQLPEYYRMADLFILPTRELEGFGLVTLEAMASGIPVLGTPVGGTREIIGKFDAGFLFENSDPDTMAVSILDNYRRIKDQPERWQAIACNCRKFVEANYSWETNIDSLEKILSAPKSSAFK